MSGKFLARASAVSLALILAACGGDESSTPLAGGSSDTSDGSGSDGENTVTLELGTGSGSDFQSGQISVSAPELSSGGVTRLEFNVVDAANGNEIFNAEPTSVTLTSQCESAILDSPVITSSGKINTSYEAACAGEDTITARLDNGATAIANVTVAPQEVGALDFVSVDPDSIALSGSSDSARGSFSEVTFKLVDKNSAAISGQTVTFSLSTTVGGITLSQTEAETLADGTVKTRVNAGTVATVVSVTATVDLPSGDRIQTTSDPISISASIPDQDSFSISVENFLPNARNYDGVSASVTIRAADRNNNKISNAVANFLTNGGAVSSECVIEDGACSVDWESQDPRPDDGVILVLARTVGEESFRDLNSDGKYSSSDGDDFDVANDDRGEAFLDRNRNGVRDADEEYFDYNSNGSYDAPDGIYNGTACADSAEANNECTKDVLEISETAQIYMASDSLQLTFTTAVAPGVVCVEVAGEFIDSDGNTVQGPPPGGTEVAFSTTNGSIVPPSSLPTTGQFRTTPVEHCVTVEADNTPDTGTFTVEATPPEPFSEAPYILQAPISD